MSNSPAALRANYTHLFGADMLPVLEEIFRYELAQHSSVRDMIMKTVTTDRDIWQSSEMHDMPLHSEVAEGTEYSYTRPKQGSSKTLVPVKFGLGFSISEEAVDDGKFDHISDAIAKMARSAKESQEIDAMNILNNGFTTETAADGVVVFSTAHTLPSGGTFRNRLSTDADLSTTSLRQMITDFETQFVGDSGIIYSVRPKNLIVPSNLRAYAQELIGSSLKADTAENNMNSLGQEGLRVISSPHLTDVDGWFLTADPSETGLRIISRKGVETRSDEDFDTDSIRYKSRYREKLGVTHAVGIFGTTGA